MTTRCCMLCGRWGERAFYQVDDDGGWACRNDRACLRRRETTARRREREARPGQSPDEKSWSDWASTEGWRVLQFRQTDYGERLPGVWVCIEAGMTFGSTARPYVLVATSREAAVEAAVELALDYLADSPTQEFARCAIGWRKEWVELRETCLTAPEAKVGSFPARDLLGVLSAQILELANKDGAKLSVVFADFDLGVVPDPPRAHVGAAFG